jgi:MraZ protein
MAFFRSMGACAPLLGYLGVSERELYQGAALQLVDADKKRLAIPASFRNAIVTNSPGIDPRDIRVTIAEHPEAPCLIGYDRGWLALAHQEASERDRQFVAENGRRDYNIKRLAGGAGEQVGFDASGRFVLPGYLAAGAGIATYAYFWGSLDYFEIWDPASLIADADATEKMKKPLRYFAAEKGIAL